MSSNLNPGWDDPLWYKDSIIYQVHVKCYKDSNQDGVGDFRGLLSKLDYLSELGVTAIWLLPFYPSPLRDDGYDIADYFGINPDYGTLRDFRAFLKAAHDRGLRVITELVINHTSDQHPWFQRARRAGPNSAWRNFYVWSDTPEKYAEARIIFKDFETSNWSWDPVAKAYYWHRFYSHQPDLNFENPRVEKEIFKVLDFWFEMGVDGLRLDAVPYLYEEEGTNCENLPQTHQYLKKLRAYVDEKYQNRMLLAEANQWPEDAVAYLGDGDECHMAFHFPVMPRLFMGVRMEDRFPVVDILEQTPAIPDNCQWAIFLRNHDELTLEMVTDEERDYMYRVYAGDPRAKINLGIRRRLAPLLENNRRKAELMNILLFSLPGTPVIYYGDEIGMGDNFYLGDRDGVRTPMQWSPDRNAGFSDANPQKLYLPVVIDPAYHHQSINVETQEMNLSSPLWWTRRVIAVRKRYKAFGRGRLEFLSADNSKILAFKREYEDELIVVVVNLSRFSQVVRLDLSDHIGMVPKEVFSHNHFPPVRDSEYTLTIGAHSHYWLLLEGEHASRSDQEPIRDLEVKEKWEEVFEGTPAEQLQRQVLPSYLKSSRWFGGKGRTIQDLAIVETIVLSSARILILEVSYTEGSVENYLLPLAVAGREEAATHLSEEPSRGVVARLRAGTREGVLYDAIHHPGFRRELLQLIAEKKRVKGSRGELSGQPGALLREATRRKTLPSSSRVLKAEQSNSSILYDNALFLKLYRRLEEGTNPDLEIEQFLTEKTEFSNIPPFAGALYWKQKDSSTMALGLLAGFVPNEGDAWTYTLDAVSRYFDRVLSRREELENVPEQPSFIEIDFSQIPALLQDVLGAVYLQSAQLLGKRTAQMHHALASEASDPDFAPEHFSMLYQRSVYQSMRNLTRRVMQALGKNLKKLPAEVQPRAQAVLEREKEILSRLHEISKNKIKTLKTRIHGDYHLGQVLFTGKDFVIIDFEGEPARALSERRLKRSPLQDLAGMVRSFHYAAYSALFRHIPMRSEDIAELEGWADIWYRNVSGVFLHSYLDEIPTEEDLVPSNKEDLRVLLRSFLLEKAVYELGYELNNRPDWVIIPIRGIEDLLSAATDTNSKG